MLGSKGEELEDELVRVGEEVVVLVDLPRLTCRLNSNSFKSRLLVRYFQQRHKSLSVSFSDVCLSRVHLLFGLDPPHFEN